MKYFKRSIWALLIVSVFIGCGKVEKSEEKKNEMSDTDMEEVEKATEGGSADGAVSLLETETLDGASEYCFKVPDSVSLFADDIFIRSGEDEEQYFRIEQGKIVETKMEIQTCQDTISFQNPYSGKEEEINLEIQCLVSEQGDFYRPEGVITGGMSESGEFIEPERAKSGWYAADDRYGNEPEWLEVTVYPAWRTNLVWLYLPRIKPSAVEAEYYLLYDIKEKKAEDVFQPFLPESFRPTSTRLNPDLRGAVVRDGLIGEEQNFYYIDACSGESIYLNELAERPIDGWVGFKNARTLFFELVRESENAMVEGFRYDLLDKKLYGELEKFTSEKLEVENSEAYVQLENNVYTLHVSGKSFPLKELDPETTYSFQASPSGDKIAITEWGPADGYIKQLCIFDIEKESFTAYPQKFSYGEPENLSWAGEDGFLIEVWGGYYYFYEF